jgi:3'(2'), 5'-bisphosphate nucleotidase
MDIERLQDILRELGVSLLQWRAEGAVEGVWQGTQFKAEADRRSHDFISGALQKSWPDIPVVSEEDDASLVRPRPDRYWLIDPIDGTASFCNGFDGFVTQAALMDGPKPVLSVVHAPALGLTYCAVRDGQATCNGRVLQLGTKAPARPVLIDNYPEPRGIAQALFRELPCGGYVESGSLGLKICRVADGTADLFVKDVVVKDWDLAPADLILQRTGGILTTLAGDAVPYAGDYARHGIIAVSNAALADHVGQWRTQYGRG